MEKPTCRTCVFWQEFEGSPEHDGTCQKNAPEPRACLRSRDTFAAWPITYAGEFCGEHPGFPAYLASLAPPPRPPDRLVMDPAVSVTSPVIRGTGVTADHVSSLIVEGWTWADVLGAYAGLTEDDIRACLGYEMARENGRA